VLKMNANHVNKVYPDQLTGMAITRYLNNDRCVTADTSGRVKMFNFAQVDFKNPELSNEQKLAKIVNPWFIYAHRKLITSIEVVEQGEETRYDESDDEDLLPEGLRPEERIDWPDLFVLTASMDWDILLHRLSNGVKIGQFAQDELWNIYDMSPYEKIRPRYVREWLQEKKEHWMDLMQARLLHAKKAGLIDEEFKVQDIKRSTKDHLRAIGINLSFNDANLNDSYGEGSTGYADDLVDHLEDDDLADQDAWKGKNLAALENNRKKEDREPRQFETRAQRNAWLNDDGNIGKYNIAMKMRPKQ